MDGVRQWCAAHNLSQYADHLIDEGYDTLEELCEIEEDDLEACEIPDVRPVGMGNCRRRAWTSLLVHQRAAAIGEALGKHQVAVGVKAGLSKLHLLLSQHEAMHPDFVTLKLDCKNAHNSVTLDTPTQLKLSLVLSMPVCTDTYL